ncbi:MAG: GNAT family N-acetyltransferase, partial [Chthoniobacterales bacterium]|nr:GNAT family N-acetyltransferase [Chthoniobacterales bacterium]
MSDFQIQPLTPETIAAAAMLFEKQLAEHGIGRSQEELASPLTTLLAEPEHGFVLLAVARQNPIGAAYAARILSLEHGGWMGWLDELYVVPAWRNRGVGSALLEATIA